MIETDSYVSFVFFFSVLLSLLDSMKEYTVNLENLYIYFFFCFVCKIRR